MDMKRWISQAPSLHKALPVLSYPGTQLIGATVNELVHSAALQAKCMQAIAQRCDMPAAVSLMDLSVEAEAFGSAVHFSRDDIPTVTAALLNEEDDPQSLAVPSIGAGRTQAYIQAIRLAKQGLDVPVFAGCIGPFSLAGRLLGLSEAMILSCEEPEFVHAVLEKATAFLLAYTQALREAGADGLIMAEPAAGLLSPAMNAAVSVPYVRRIIAAVQGSDFAVIYHNCGNTVPLIEGILQTGADAFHFANAVALADILPQIPAQYPVLGNLDPAGQLRSGTPESVRESTLRLLQDCAGFSHFIPSSGCDIPPNTPLENLDAFFGAVAAFYDA